MTTIKAGPLMRSLLTLLERLGYEDVHVRAGIEKQRFRCGPAAVTLPVVQGRFCRGARGVLRESTAHGRQHCPCDGAADLCTGAFTLLRPGKESGGCKPGLPILQVIREPVEGNFRLV